MLALYSSRVRSNALLDGDDLSKCTSPEMGSVIRTTAAVLKTSTTWGTFGTGLMFVVTWYSGSAKSWPHAILWTVRIRLSSSATSIGMPPSCRSTSMICAAVALGGGVSIRRLTTQAQRPGLRGDALATRVRWPGSLRRMVRPLVCFHASLHSQKTDARVQSPANESPQPSSNEVNTRPAQAREKFPGRTP